MSDVTRPEFSESIARIHSRVDDIQKTVIIIEQSSKRIEKFGDDMHKVIYGNGGNNGLVIKITKLFERVSLHTKLIFCIVPALLGVVFFLAQQALSK